MTAQTPAAMAGLLVRPVSLAKHSAAPLLRERELFLLHRASEGYHPSSVLSMASGLLHVLRELRLSELRPIRLDEIERAAEVWSKDTQHRQRKNGGRASKAQFKTVARAFLQFHGYLDRVPLPAPFHHERELFIANLIQQRGFLETTITYQRETLRRFFAWVAQRRASLREIAPSDIAGYVAFKRETCSPVSLASACLPVRMFLAFAEQKGWCNSLLREPLKLPPRRRHNPDAFYPSWADVERMVAPGPVGKEQSHRSRAFLLLAAIYGLRISEIAKLQVNSIDWRDETMRVQRAKNGRVQQYPLQYEVAEAIRNYLVHERPQCSSKNLFVTLTRPYRAIPPCHVTTVARSRMLELGITSSHLGAHSIRHACATQLLRSGSSLRQIADFLGHKGLGTVSIYAKFDLGSLREVADFSYRGVL